MMQAPSLGGGGVNAMPNCLSAARKIRSTRGVAMGASWGMVTLALIRQMYFNDMSGIRTPAFLDHYFHCQSPGLSSDHSL